VWLDTNKNGVQDSGEAGVAGVTVKLLNAAGAEVATATTDANGNYLFQGLVPGNYSVKVIAPTGYTFTAADQGGNDALDSDVNQTTGITAQTTLVSGENDPPGMRAWLPERSYGDRVWLDKNANGVQDAGEAGLAGVTVKLLNSAGSVVATTTTDANGNYLFNNLTPGDYSAQVVAPTGYFVSAKDQGGNDATDSDFDPTTGKTVSTTLVAGENDLSWDAGLYQKASIGDKVWADCDNDGIQDAGEAGVPGVTVKLLDASGNVIATTLTDGNGNYVFKDLMPGTYSVQFVAPAGYTFTTKDVGSNDAIDSDVGSTVSAPPTWWSTAASRTAPPAGAATVTTSRWAPPPPTASAAPPAARCSNWMPTAPARSPASIRTSPRLPARPTSCPSTWPSVRAMPPPPTPSKCSGKA
jgi:uncharacterized surface anchored protein